MAKKKSNIKPLKLNKSGQIIKPVYPRERNLFAGGGNIAPISASGIMSSIASPTNFTNTHNVSDIKDPRGAGGGGGLDVEGFGISNITAGLDLVGGIMGMSKALVDPNVKAQLGQAQGMLVNATGYDDLMDEWGSHSNIGHVSRKQAGGMGGSDIALSTLSNIGAGAAAGSFAGPLGMGIGAGIGAIGSVVGGLFGKNKARKQLRKINTQIDQANQFAQDSFVNRAQNIDSLIGHSMASNYFSEGGQLNSFTLGGPVSNYSSIESFENPFESEVSTLKNPIFANEITGYGKIQPEKKENPIPLNTPYGRQYKNIVEKQEHYDYLSETYGPRVKYREDFLNAYDKPLRSGQLEKFRYNVDLYNPENKIYDYLMPVPEELSEDFLQYHNIKNEVEKMQQNWKNYESVKDADKQSKAFRDKYEKQLKLRKKILDSPHNPVDHLDIQETTWRQALENRDDVSNKALLFASLMEEGGNVYNNDMVISGFLDFGLDRIGENIDELISKNYLPKDILDRIDINYGNIRNEKNEIIQTANFSNFDDVITVKNAILNQERDLILKVAKKEGIELSDKAIEYFTIAGYNGGRGNAAKMLKKFKEDGLLEDDKFLEVSPDSYKRIHENVMRRLDIAKMLEEEGVIKNNNMVLGDENILDRGGFLNNINMNTKKHTNIFAQGGNLNLFAMGGDFDTGINMIDAGGTHEENPMGGVPMGFDLEGTPNMVEEGEVIYNDYVFSNRVVADASTLSDNLIDSQYDGYTFAKIAEEISKSYEERPNDPIAKRGLLLEMSRLIAAQESQKLMDEEAQFGEQLAQEASGIPQENMGQLMLDPGMMDEQMMLLDSMGEMSDIGNMDIEGLDPSMMGDMTNMQPMAYGGNLNSKMKSMSPTLPTNLQSSKFNHLNMFAYGGPIIPSGIFNDPNMITDEGDFNIYGHPNGLGAIDTMFDNNGYLVNYIDHYSGKNLSSLQQRAISRYNFLNSERLTREGKTLTHPDGSEYVSLTSHRSNRNRRNAINNRTRGPYDNPSTPMKGQAARDHAEIQHNNSTQAGNTQAGNTKSPQVSPYIPLSLPSLNKYASVTKGNPSSDVSLPSDYHTIYSKMADERRLREYNLMLNKRGLGVQDLRYMPAIGSSAMALTDMFGLTNKPNYSYADLIARSADGLQDYEAKHLGNYMLYTPFDRDYQLNKLNAIHGSTQRSIVDQAGGNRGAAMAGLLALDRSSQDSMGDLGIQADQYNQLMRQLVEQFNTGINQFNIQQDMTAHLMNQLNAQARMNALAMAAQMRQLADGMSAQAKSANFSGALLDIGNIGRESMAREMIMSNPALYYSIDSRGNITYKNGYLNLPKESKTFVDLAAKLDVEKKKNEILEEENKKRETSNNKARGGYLNPIKL